MSQFNVKYKMNHYENVIEVLHHSVSLQKNV